VSVAVADIQGRRRPGKRWT